MHEHRFIVPNADRSAVLVVDGRLPVVRSSGRRRQPEMLAALADEHGIRATFLRTIRFREEDGARSTLVELDAGMRPDHAQWLAIAAVDPDTVVPVHSEGVAEWLAEQRGSIPADRAPWARRGWLTEVVHWVKSVVPSADAPRLLRQWPLSAMYTFDSDLGVLYLKACFVLWPQEPALTRLLAHEHPRRVPEVVAINGERGWLLMRGVVGEDVADAGGLWFAEELRSMAHLQLGFNAKTRALLGTGAPQRPLEQVRQEAPDLGHLCARLHAFGIPETLTHGDLHQWNAMVAEGRVVIIDWSDAAIAHPFLDLGAMLFYAEGNSQDREALVDAYIDCWREFGPEAALREAAAIGEALGCVYQALSFRAINAAFEPSDRWLFANEADRWLSRARDLAAKL
jgi:tRNA A-37 threonylcarbamoyl transferase component Bud32